MSAKQEETRLRLADQCRHQLGQLVTEVRGASTLLYCDGVTANEDTAAAIGLWLERIAHDLELMEGGILRGDLAGDAEAGR